MENDGAETARWSAEQVLALAPDAASQKAGSRLGGPGPWSEAGSGEGAVWGLCKGSGRTPYRTVVDVAGADGTAYRCSCPSRKFPCKHALGLLLLWAGGPSAVGAGTPPDWAREWLADRRAREVRRTARAEERAAGGDSGAGGPGGPASDPEAARKRAERRSARIGAGAQELESRLADLLNGGLAGADGGGHTAWEEVAARMVDAQAPGLAARIREVGAVPSSGPGWPDRMLAQCALLHLLDVAYLGVERLPEPLAATVRTRVGLTVGTAELLAGADEDARRRDHWVVLGSRDEQEQKVTARRIWLRGRESGRLALLLSFGAAGRSPELALPVGESADAELVHYPAAAPLRAALAARHGTAPDAPVPSGGAAADAVAAYGAALCDDPWLESWPTVLSRTVPIPGDAREGLPWQLADADGGEALDVAPGTGTSALWKLASLSGGEPLTVFGEVGHAGFTPVTAWAPHAGSAAEAVPL